MTDISSLASAILQYKYGNPYIKSEVSINNNNYSYIITNDLGTLTKYNWIKWENIQNNFTKANLSAEYTVNYNSNNNYNYDWVTRQYPISSLIP